MKLKALMLLTIGLLSGCGDQDQVIGNLTAFRCTDDMCQMVITSSGFANDPVSQEFTTCSKKDELEAIAGRKVIAFKSPVRNCMTTYEYLLR